MKSLILMIRAAFAAFMRVVFAAVSRVCGAFASVFGAPVFAAFCPSGMNLRGGGGQK